MMKMLAPLRPFVTRRQSLAGSYMRFARVQGFFISAIVVCCAWTSDLGAQQRPPRD